MASCVTGRKEDSGYQLAVVVLMLLLSVTWLVVYTTVVNAGTFPVRLTPELAARLAREHDQEIHQLELQVREIYGGQMPVAAGS